MMKDKLFAKLDQKKLLCLHYNVKDELVLLFNSEKEKIEWWYGLEYFVKEAKNDHTLMHVPTMGKKQKAKESAAQNLAGEIFLRAD
mmetsp:Transcript_39467/g.35224  ORF Transcript_39467/g.35224 Transcript_39467/m.35224 type:complete len:86 (-) Transcript_39467:2095-2352(-)